MEARACVITGAGGAIGSATALRLVRDRWTVVGVDAAETSLQRLQEEARAGAGFFIPVAGDVTKRDILVEAARQAGAAGVLQGWVNNAAVFMSRRLERMTAADIHRVIEVNLTAVIHGCAVAAGEMINAGTSGAIVNVSSMQAQRVIRGHTVYAAAKAGIEGLTRGAAVELGPLGIRVNAIAPGTIWESAASDGDAESPDDESAKRRVSHSASLHALRRVGAPGEVASVIAFLLSEDASNMSGATVAVDGGRSVYAHSRY